MNTRLVSQLLPVLMFLSSCGPIWKSPNYFTEYQEIEVLAPILTMDQYAQLSAIHSRPYVVKLSTANGALVVFGAEHTRDPKDPQLVRIQQLWNELRPTVALIEGRLGLLFRWTMDPTEKYGESGFVFDLAKNDGIPVYTWESPLTKEVEALLAEFPKKRVALYYVLRPYLGQMRFGKPDDPDAFVESTRRQRVAIPGLEGSLHDIVEIDSIWQADFQGFQDWRSLSDMYGWPGYLSKVAEESNLYRDKHLMQVIIHFVRRGDRVFVVCGSSHAVMLEKALTATLSR